MQSLNKIKSILLGQWDVQEDNIEALIGKMNRLDYSDIYFQQMFNESWSIDGGVIKPGNFSAYTGFSIRAISGEKTAFTFSDTISKVALNECSNIVMAISRQGGGQAKVQNFSFSKNHAIQHMYDSTNPLKLTSMEHKISVLKNIENLAKIQDKRIKYVTASLSNSYEIILVASSNGKLIGDIRPLVRFSVNVIAEENGRSETGRSGWGGRAEFSSFEGNILQKHVTDAVHEAIINLHSKPAPAGKMPVILGPGWPGILIHEAVGHGLEGDFNRKGISVFSGKLGEKVASNGVTVVDNGAIPGKRGSLNIDDEGNSTRENVLIENGVLVGFMQDHLNASLMNAKITGNARRESYASLPMPRMTNTYMLAGNDHPEEILKTVKYGLYAVNFGGGQVDITSGKFVFSASEAYLIENGKIMYPVKGATLIGSGIETMNKISMIGNDLLMDSGVGTCGKDGQNVPVGVGMPTLKIDELIVGGTSNAL